MDSKSNTKKKTTAAKTSAAKKTTTKPTAKKTTTAKTTKKPAVKTNAKKETGVKTVKNSAKKTVAAKKNQASVKAPAKKASSVKVKQTTKASAVKSETASVVTPKPVTEVKNIDKGGNKLIRKVDKLFNLYFFQGILCSVIVFIIGVFLMSRPAIATRTAEIITAIILIVVGLAAAFNNSFKDKFRIFNYNLVFGVVTIILGALIIINPFSLSSFLTISFGIFMIINGLIKLDGALNLKRVNEESWTLMLTMGIINAIFGIVLIFNPFANLYFTQVIGMFMILYAIMEFTEMVLLKQRSKSFLNLLK